MPKKPKIDELEYHRKYYYAHKQQMNIQNKDYYEIHKKDILARVKRNYEKDRTAFFLMYGKVCACCGESILAFLTIEHKKGRQHHSSSGDSYREAIIEYRPDLFETLCMNCNHAKGRFGICPHQIKNQN